MEVKGLEFRVFLPERACQPRGHNQQLRLKWDVPKPWEFQETPIPEKEPLYEATRRTLP